MPLIQISTETQNKAATLLEQYKNQPGVNLVPLQAISQGQHISAEQLAILKAQKQPYTQFLLDHRHAITTQLVIDKRTCSAVALFVFRGTDGNKYVIINENQGILSDIKPAQWTSIHARVETNERELVSPQIYDLCGSATRYAPELTLFAVAATRSGRDQGLDTEQFPIEKILTIKRGQYGLPEVGADKYRTEHICVVLKSCDPLVLANALRANEFGDRLHCVPVQQFLADTVLEANTPYLTVQNVKLPIRPSLWTFARSLFQLNIMDKTVHTDSDPITDRKSYSGTDYAGYRVFRSDIPEDIQFTLFHDRNNKRRANDIYEIANLVEGNPEDIAANSLRDNRILLRETIAQIILYIVVLDGQFDDLVWRIYNQALKKAQTTHVVWSDEMENEKASLVAKITKQKANNNNGSFSNVTSTPDEIARGLVEDKYHTLSITQHYSVIVQDVIQAGLRASHFTALPTYPLNQRINCCVMGPIASGKSASVKQIKQDNPTVTFNLLGSDEFVNILLTGQNTDNYMTHRGALILSEAWYIKERFLALLRAITSSGNAPCIIYETMNVRNVPLDNALAENGKFVTYMNTADATNAIDRMESRGKKENRYVDPQSTLNSYQAISRYFIGTITYLIDKIGDKPATIILRDTDALFYQGSDPKPEPILVEITFGGTPTLSVHNFAGLMVFFERANKTAEIGKTGITWELPQDDKKDHARNTLASLIKLFPTVKIKRDDAAASDTLKAMNVTRVEFI